MARLHTQTARKVHRCGKCGRDIKPGEAYFWYQKRYGPKQTRCLGCKPRQSELHSGYLADIYGTYEDLDDWEARYENNFSQEGIEDLKSILDYNTSVLETMADELEEKADNIEEYFPSSEVADSLRERSDGAREAAREMEELQSFLDTTEELTEEVWDQITGFLESIRSSLMQAEG